MSSVLSLKAFKSFQQVKPTVVWMPFEPYMKKRDEDENGDSVI